MKTQSKSILAKLLAQEKINVLYAKVKTASFNTKSRTLTLPMWTDISEDMTDMLIGHEVGHALDTPNDGWINVVDNLSKQYKNIAGFVNVVEDARIERNIKEKFPGLKKAFTKAYREMYARNFFETAGKDVNKFLLIDRLNLAFKLGPMFHVEFTEFEKTFIRKIEQCQTFDDVVEISIELHGYCKDEFEKKKEQDQKEYQEKLESGELDDEYDTDSSYDDFDYDFDDLEDPDGDDPSEVTDFKPGDEDIDDDSMDDIRKGYTESKELAQYQEELKSITEESMEQNLQKMTEDKTVTVAFCPSDYDPKNYIVSYKKIGKLFDDELYVKNDDDTKFEKNLLTDFESKNKNAIMYLVKEFEMRKKAAEFARTTISDTGVLDTNKLHTYKFNDDIFRKIGNLPQGKNHGIVMFLDWSGSMQDNMKGTIEQVITLATFCRKVNIPFELYAFSSEYSKTSPESESRKKKPLAENELSTGPSFGYSLLNFLSSRMKNTEYRNAANELLNYADALELAPGGYRYKSYKHVYIRKEFGLGGTPLNATIIIAHKIINDFRTQNKIECVNTIFMTDGEDSKYSYVENEHYSYTRIQPPTYSTVSYVEDKITGKKYRVGEKGITPILLQILKDRTQTNLIGFYIIKPAKRNFTNQICRLDPTLPLEKMWLEMKNQKFSNIDDYGYNQYFLIPGGDALSTEDDSLDEILGNKEEKSFTAKRLKTAFLKLNKNRLTNRVLLAKVIEEIT